MIDSVSSIGQRQADLKRTRRQKPAPATVDRLPPNDPEAEQAVLGSIFLDPAKSPAVIAQCVESFQEGSGVFFDLRHTAIYEAIIKLWDSRQPVDVLTVCDALKKEDMLEMCGGMAYLATLPDTVFSVENVGSYVAIVKEKFLLRTAVRLGTEIAGMAYEPSETFDDTMEKVEAGLIQLSRAKTFSGIEPIQNTMRRVTDIIESYVESKGALTGIATGFTDLDRMTRGMQNGDMIVIAARPSMGKTSLALNIADSVAAQNKIPVGFFSLEMTTEALLLRMVCSRARVNFANIRDGFLAERDFPKLTGAMGRLANSPLYIDDASGITLLQLRTRMRRMVQLYGIRIFFIDYLQLLESGLGRRDGRQQEVADISKGIKSIAKELNVPVVVLAQLNRDIEKDKNRKPRLADLRESGAIEQDADVVGLLYKSVVSEDEDEDRDREQDVLPINLLIAKQRNGPTGDVALTFLKSYTRFESAARVSDVDEPQTERRAEQTEIDV